MGRGRIIPRENKAIKERQEERKMSYECQLCKKNKRFRHGSRKILREHIKNYHGVKSGKSAWADAYKGNSPITEAMKRTT